MRRALRERIARWFDGRNRPRQGSLELAQRNVYVLPSRAGILYALVLLAMLVASINYALSLGYLLTFLLAGVAIVTMLHTFANLAALSLRAGRADPVHAGQPAEFSLELTNRRNSERHAIRLQADGMAAPALADIAPGTAQMVRIALPTVRRGWMELPRLTLWTTYPLGLWRAWAWWRPAMRVLVYPAPETPAVPLPAAARLAGGGQGNTAGEDDLAAIRPFRDGDSSRRIAWKAVARTASDELLTKEFDGGARGELLLDWQMLPAHLDTETRLSRLTRWVLDADAAGAQWALRLPGRFLELDHGAVHRERCLEALATLEA